MNSLSNRNALSKYLIEDLKFVINEIKDNRDIYAAIFDSSSPNTFCAGADLKERIKMNVKEVKYIK